MWFLGWSHRCKQPMISPWTREISTSLMAVWSFLFSYISFFPLSPTSLLTDLSMINNRIRNRNVLVLLLLWFGFDYPFPLYKCLIINNSSNYTNDDLCLSCKIQNIKVSPSNINIVMKRKLKQSQKSTNGIYTSHHKWMNAKIPRQMLMEKRCSIVEGTNIR